MIAIAEQVGQEVLSDVLQEAVNEVRGRSSRKWGVALVSLLLGMAIAIAFVQLRRRQLSAQGDAGAVSPGPTPPTAAPAG